MLHAFISDESSCLSLGELIDELTDEIPCFMLLKNLKVVPSHVLTKRRDHGVDNALKNENLFIAVYAIFISNVILSWGAR